MNCREWKIKWLFLDKLALVLYCACFGALPLFSEDLMLITKRTTVLAHWQARLHMLATKGSDKCIVRIGRFDFCYLTKCLLFSITIVLMVLQLFSED
jgi:hypothetical protein